MKRFLTVLVVLISAIGFVVASASAAEKATEKKPAAPAKKPEFKYEDKIGVVKVKKGDPIHIACWMVVAGPDASLGTDTKRGVEIAVGDVGG